jgi:hypothetical protein
LRFTGAAAEHFIDRIGLERHMRMIYALFVVVMTLVVLNKLPYPGHKQIAATSPVTAAVAAPPAEAQAPAVVVKPEPRIHYVSNRQCARSVFGSTNCTELTTAVLR